MNNYVLPNRKTFADSIVRIFKKYRDLGIDPLDTEEKDVDLCQKDLSSRELYPHQKLVREYLLAETPYRGLLIYHGLGSGKTCAAIAVAESLLTTKHVYVMAPASLLVNFQGELRKCGNPIYQFDQHWEVRVLKSDQDRAEAKGMGISDGFLDSKMRFFITVPGRQSNWRELPADVQKGISAQIDDIISQRFTFIAYNGISKTNVDTIFPPDKPHMFDDSVVIVDESHNFISTVVGESVLKTKIYDMIYQAKNAKIVCLSGTPVLNRPNEIAYLMNLIRGPIERVSIPTKQVISWDEGLMTAFFRTMTDVDTIEYNSVKKMILLSRNPPNFESVYNEKNERIAVRYNKDLPYDSSITNWVETWRGKFAREFGGIELADADQITKQDLECLPTDFEEFMTTFVDGLKIKNPLMFQRRIQGLVSYFKGADERLLPKRIEEDKTLVKLELSPDQFNRYLEVRWEEIQMDSRRGRMKNEMNEDMGTYRVPSRLVCNYAVPAELVPKEKGEKIDKEAVLETMRKTPERFFSADALNKFSPKMAAMLAKLKENAGDMNNQLVYSFFRTLEGLGIFSAVLDANGYQRYKIIKDQGVWKEDPSMKTGVPAYALYTGEGDKEELEYYRQIFNGNYEQGFPESLKETITEKRLCIFMISKTGAEGITLNNVRDVHIMEGHWNPSLIDQVIGRAIRICSHARLPMPERTVRVHWYLAVFSKEQSVTSEGNNIVPIRRNDMELKRYEGETPVETFMTSDEYVYEVAYRKGRITKNLTHLLKQAAVDCEIHRKLHSKEQPVIQCMQLDQILHVNRDHK